MPSEPCRRRRRWRGPVGSRTGTGYGIFGYDYNRDTKTRSINEAEANVVKMMFQWASEGVNVYQISVKLNRQNIRTKMGFEWHPLT